MLKRPMKIILVLIVLTVGILIGIFLPTELQEQIRREGRDKVCNNLQTKMTEYCSSNPGTLTPSKPEEK